MPKTLDRVAVSVLFLVSALVALGSAATFPEAAPQTVPVYMTITEVITYTETFTATVASVSVQSLTQTNTRTVTSVTTSVTTAVGVLGPLVAKVFKQYIDVAMLAAGIALGGVVDLVIMLAMGVREKERAAEKEEYVKLLEDLQKFEDGLQTAKAKKLEKRLEARVQADRVTDLGWLSVLKWIFTALVTFFAILVLILAVASCFWC